MAEFTLKRNITVSKPIHEVFGFFADAGNLQKICPPELNFLILTSSPIELKKGATIEYKLHLHGFPIYWKTLISEWNPPYSFVDKSLKGPYKQWIHEHIFTENENGGTDIEDIVRYRLPFEPLGDIGHWLVCKELENIFDYRQKIVEQTLNL